MRRLVAVGTLAACLAGPTSALAQNDWQFPDPYFGAIELDVSRPSGQRQRRVESAPLACSRGEGLPVPRRQAWRQAEPGWRSVAGMQ